MLFQSDLRVPRTSEADRQIQQGQIGINISTEIAEKGLFKDR